MAAGTAKQQQGVWSQSAAGGPFDTFTITDADGDTIVGTIQFDGTVGIAITGTPVVLLSALETLALGQRFPGNQA